MAELQIQGVIAAALTPRNAAGAVDAEAMKKAIEFTVRHGIFSYAINGATGEFCLTTPEQLRTMLSLVRSVAGDRATMLCGVGAAGLAQTLELSQIASEEGAAALLLPMPYFFPYDQDDLEIFCRAVAKSVKLPILLYNLPKFTSGLEEETVCKLISDVPNIIGIKDSGCSLKILRALTHRQIKCLRIVGHDGVFAQALKEQVCDGIVSGIAGVFPEVIQALYAHRDNRDADEFRHSQELIEELIPVLDSFPAPWALKWIAEARGIMRATFAQPVSHRRAEESRRIIDLIPKWQARIHSSVTPSLL